MSKSTEKKSRQLKTSFGAASNKLRKAIMFHLVQKYRINICHRCGEKIQSEDSLSIEHKIPWLDSTDPVGLFFEMENIAFSHLSCNVSHARKSRIIRPCPSAAAYARGCRCKDCVEANRQNIENNGIKQGSILGQTNESDVTTKRTN